MNFGKITFGTLLLAVGVLLLAVRVGFAHPDTPIVLLRYWPVLLIAFGLAFLAGAIKNPMLGCFAILIILGGTAAGVYWMHTLKKEGKLLKNAGSSLDLGKVGATSLLVRVYTFAGTLDLNGSSSRLLTVVRHDVAVDSAVGYRFDVNGGKAVLVWPRAGSTFALGAPGAKVELRVPPALPMTLRWSGRLGAMHANLAHVEPTRCLLHEIFSSAVLDLGTYRPEEIRVWGLGSSLRVRIPADCPVRVVSQSPFVLRSLPSDFEELATGNRAKNRVDAADGRGPPVKIFVEGPFVQIAVERLPMTRVATQEGKAWPVTGTASRSRSHSS